MEEATGRAPRENSAVPRRTSMDRELGDPWFKDATKHLQLKMGEHVDSPPDCRARNEKTAKINHTGKVIKVVEELEPNNQWI